VTSDLSAVTTAFLEHLTDHDVAVLARQIGPGGAADDRAWLAQRRGGIDDLLSSQALVEFVFYGGRDSDPLTRVSPFLVFAVAVQYTTLQLRSASYVPEWVGIGQRIPIFDMAPLREFASSPWHRLFLTELLTSYTHVASGSVITAGRRGLRRQRFSELDPVRLAGLLEVVPESDRPGVLRRLGDSALFLTSVFPDYVARRGFGPIEQARLGRSGRLGADWHDLARGTAPTSALRNETAVDLLDQLGRRWYQAAIELIPRPVPANLAVLAKLPERFGDARRILGLVTDRFLFADRNRWFGPGAA
jgi:hypothetical protein